MDIKLLKKNQSENFNSNFFDDSYTHIYKDLLNLELEDQLSFLENNYFKNNKEINALDFCCGTGRHLIPLVKKGYKLSGIDINTEYINYIYEETKLLPNKPSLYDEDVQDFRPDDSYDLIYSIESSIGYLPDYKTLNIFKNICSLLNVDGKFILHLINKDNLISKLEQRMWFGNDDNGYCLENRELNLEEGTIQISQVRIIDGISKKYKVDLRLFTLKEIEILFKLSGLKIKNVYGDYKTSDFTIESPYMIIEAIKN